MIDLLDGFDRYILYSWLARHFHVSLDQMYVYMLIAGIVATFVICAVYFLIEWFNNRRWRK